MQTRPYSNAASGPSSVQQSKGEYKVLSKSNLTLRKGITVYTYGYIKDKAWFICIKLSFYTCRVSFYKYIFTKYNYFPYIRVFLKRGFVTILSAVEHVVPTAHGRQPFLSKITLVHVSTHPNPSSC